MSTFTRGLAGGIAGAALMAGCARGPALSESADRLKADSSMVMPSATRWLAAPGAKARVVSTRTAPCPDGKAHRTLLAELPLRPSPSASVPVNHASAVMLDLIGGRGYRLTTPPKGKGRNRTFTMTRDVPAVTFTVRLYGGPKPVMRLEGDTPCLRDDT
ncbi:hypothetical protein [Spirillospora sp. CA-294931]|uniref:hypothetical protein n=1 Tax=Spirillospora sp. CA-294931 TaxID=3240042 RepID=UPI003D8F1E88